MASAPVTSGTGPHRLVIRPELLEMATGATEPGCNDLSGRVRNVLYQGDSVLVLVAHDSGEELTVRVPANRASKGGLPSVGDHIGLSLHAEDTIIVPETAA